MPAADSVRRATPRLRLPRLATSGEGRVCLASTHRRLRPRLTASEALMPLLINETPWQTKCRTIPDPGGRVTACRWAGVSCSGWSRRHRSGFTVAWGFLGSPAWNRDLRQFPGQRGLSESSAKPPCHLWSFGSAGQPETWAGKQRPQPLRTKRYPRPKARHAHSSRI